MGKNQQHKQMQMQRHNSSTDGPPGTTEVGDGMVDASFHTPEWHAARIAQLTTERLTWEEWKIKKKEDDKRRAAEEDAEEALMREYRKQLDADREKKLARGWNHKDLRDKLKSSKKRKRDSKDKKDKKSKKSKDKDSKDKKKRKKARKEHKREGSSDGSGSSSSEDEKGERGEEEDEDKANPYRLSNFFGS